jgi:hypothetical protein
LTWWELEDWYNEPGVVPDHDRNVIAPWFDGLVGQAAVSVAFADQVEIDEGQVEVQPSDATVSQGRGVLAGTGEEESLPSSSWTAPAVEPDYLVAEHLYPEPNFTQPAVSPTRWWTTLLTGTGASP